MDDPHLGQSVPETFDRLQTDIERVEFILNCHSFIRDFELRSKYGIKSFEKAVQFRDVVKEKITDDPAFFGFDRLVMKLGALLNDGHNFL